MSVISEISSVQFAGLAARTVNYSAVGFVLAGLEEQEDVGMVSSGSTFTSMMIWNGADTPDTISGIEISGDDGIELSWIEEGTVIPPKSSARANFEVTEYGPLVIDASYVFDSPCVNSVTFSIIGSRLYIPVDQPRPITLEDAIVESYAVSDPNDTFFDTLEFTETSSGSSVRVVHSDEDLNTPQGLFTACRFGCQHPETAGGIVGALEITVDFLPLAAQRWIREKSKTGTGVTVMWRQYLGPDQEPEAYYPLPLDVTSVEQSWTGVTVTASFPMLTSMKFPRRLMTTSVLPGGK